MRSVKRVTSAPRRESAPATEPQAVTPAARGRVLLREVAWVLGAKALLLVVLWAAFFGPANRPRVDPSTVGQALIAPVRPDSPATLP